MKRFISTKKAIEYCDKKECIIPSEFLAVFPNNFGINLCSVKGFNVEIQDDGQLKSIETIFIPATEEEIKKEQDPENPIDHTWALKALEEQGENTTMYDTKICLL